MLGYAVWYDTTLSYEGLREAWDDRRYIETLKRIAAMKDKEEEFKCF